MSTKWLSIFLTILSFAIITNCSKKKDEISNAEISYLKGLKSLEHKNYSEAAETFEKIDDDFPFSKWALKAQTMAIYARYKDEDYTKLLQVADDFLRLNPASEYVPYILYMKGLSYYRQIPSIERSQDDTKQSSFTFRELIARFPDTSYAFDAREKLDFVDEHLAGAKMSIGRYQIKNRNYIGAINNFSEVIARYHQSKQLPEAFFRIAEIYYKIGLKEEADKALAQLKLRFPQSYWTKLTEKEWH